MIGFDPLFNNLSTYYLF